MVPPSAQLTYPETGYAAAPAAASSWPSVAKWVKFAGPGFLVAVGYRDPGNWATDIAGGSQYGYALLSVVIASNLFAMFLQYLALKLGIATDLDLAQATAQSVAVRARRVLWFISELGMIACSLAEILGAALAIQLLFGFGQPIAVGLAGVNMLLLLLLQKKGLGKLEGLVAAMVVTVAACLGIELVLSQPALASIAAGLVSNPAKTPEMIYLACGILGATIMPHNLFLHSSLSRPRIGDPQKATALRAGTIGTVATLTLATAINAGLLILAGAVFYPAHAAGVADLTQAYRLMPSMLGVSFAGSLFALALWLSSQSAAVTSAMAGQIVLDGFGVVNIPPARLQMISRSLAIVPAFVVSLCVSQHGLTALLVLSQVILSLQLPFVAIPLVRLTSDTALMGDMANGRTTAALGWALIAAILLSDCALVWSLL
jgi:manganese transport protein